MGCGKKDGPLKPIPPAPIVYPDRSTPENALLYMTIAFSNRDSVRTDSIYADDYEGTSTDLIDPSQPTFVFAKSDEIKVVAAMAQSSSITYVNVDFKHPNTWASFHYATDPPEWVTIQIPNFIIEVHELTDGFTARSPASGETWIFEFTLKPTTPDLSSPTDTTWQIVRWVESRSLN